MVDQLIERIFVSSTSEDLVSYRNAARDAILACEAFPDMMEYWSAMDQHAVDICLNRVSQANIYIGIFAHRYGYCPDKSDVSITELEFDRATEVNIPRFCFLVDEKLNWPQQFIENEPGKSKLERFKDDKVNSVVVRRTFDSPIKLELEIVKALMVFRNEQFRLRVGDYEVTDMTKPVTFTHQGKNSVRAKMILYVDKQIDQFDHTQFLKQLTSQYSIDLESVTVLQLIEGSTIIQIELEKADAETIYQSIREPQIQDVTPQQNTHVVETYSFQDYEQQLRQVELLREAIVRNVSHELKIPLLHVKSAVSLLAEEVGKDNKLIRYADNAIARLETIVTNITIFGSSGYLNLSPVIISDAVEYAHRNLQRIWESREQTKRIQLYLDRDLPPVLADRQGLSTILQLLMDNAIKFSSGDIEIHAHQIGNEVEIAVKDYGIGIEKDQMATIFDSFYQIDSSHNRQYGGTGVGLALVKLLVEKHNSQIVVTSKLDAGSTFKFLLPIAKFE